MAQTEEERREAHRILIRRLRARAQSYVDQVRAATSCEEEGCTRGPIEWHNPEHDQAKGRQISHMVGAGRSIAAIAAEIATCRALCRFHHVRIDGRIRNLDLSPTRRSAA